jgi:hypothetical protein
VTLSLPSLAHAETTFFSHALDSVQAASDGFQSHVNDVLDPTGGAVSASQDGVFDEGTATAFSSGNLSTGEMKAYSDVEASQALGSGALSAQARVDIGDSFRATSGNSPFVWTSDSQASFTFDVSGVVDMVTDGGALDDYVQINNSRIGLTILAPGTLDAYARWAAGDDAAYAGWGDQVIADFTYNLGPGTQDAPYVNGTATSYPASFTATFTPGSDFDWVMSLDLLMNLQYPSGAAARGLADFSHTVTASYAGPQGATTLSASGLFPGTVALNGAPAAVPEPGTWALLIGGFGLSGAALRRRRRRVHPSPCCD